MISNVISPTSGRMGRLEYKNQGENWVVVGIANFVAYFILLDGSMNSVGK